MDLKAKEGRQQGAKQAASALPKPRPPMDKLKLVEEGDVNPTPQENSSIWPEAIFGVDVILKELDQVTEIIPSFAWLNNITQAIYTQVIRYDDRLNRKLTLELFNYYTIATYGHV